MTDKEDELITKDILNKWAHGEYGKSFTVIYHVVVKLNKWPIVLWDREGFPCNDINLVDFEPVVANFVKDYGLTQSTLWDTYKECGSDISVTRIRRG